MTRKTDTRLLLGLILFAMAVLGALFGVTIFLRQITTDPLADVWALLAALRADHWAAVGESAFRPAEPGPHTS